MKTKWTGLSLAMIAGLVLLPLACSKNADTEDSNSNQGTESPAIASQKTDKNVSKNAGGARKGGQEVKMDQFTLVIPEDWEKNQHLDVWSPSTEADSRTMPDHYLNYGARNPMMLNNSDLIEGIKTHIGVEPQDIKLVELGGMNGAICGWEKGKYQSVGLFLQEKITGFDIPMLNFFILRAPKDSFPQYEETYRAILESIRI